MGLREEIFEQPEVLSRLREGQFDRIRAVAAEIKQAEFQFVYLAARGTSDNAGIYAKYIFGIKNQLAVALACPSIFSIYGKAPNLGHSLVLGISQSGQSPDIVSVLSAGKRLGIPTLSITNDADSPLAKSSDYLIDIMAGQENAIAATKTYTGELMAIAMLSAALASDEDMFEEIKQIPSMVRQVLSQETLVEKAVNRFFYMTHCSVIGRGYNRSTAFEWALKLKELVYIIAEPYSSADFLHGPVAILHQGFPVLAIIPEGHIFENMSSVIKALKQDHGVQVVLISTSKVTKDYADIELPLPDGLPEWLSPIVAIVYGQLFSFYLAKLRGLNPDKPRSLEKVTKTI